VDEHPDRGDLHRDLLDEHVRRFNEGVATGDFGPMLEQFAEDSQMSFEGVPVGPFEGRDAIAAAYRDRPPDDRLDVLDARDEDGVVVARYAWRKRPDLVAGRMFLTPRGGQIARLVITFDPPEPVSGET
jgi:steroid delta-isomerase